jgi:hypothetical protein
MKKKSFYAIATFLSLIFHNDYLVAQVKSNSSTTNATVTKNSNNQVASSVQYFNPAEHVYIDGNNKTDSPKYKNGFAKIGKLGKPEQKVFNNYLYGYIDESKRIIVKPEYYILNDFSEGLCRACKELPNGKFMGGFLNSEGKTSIPFEYNCDFAGNFSEGLSAVEKGDLYGFIDKTARLVVPYSYKSVGAEGFENGRARVTKSDWFESTLYIDKTGKIVDQKGDNSAMRDKLINGSGNSNQNNNSGGLDRNAKKYCVNTTSGKYEISLTEGGSNHVYYKLYNQSGVLQKTMQGNWILRDEGVYGTAYIITITWTGANSGMPDLKFICQYDGNRELQAIIDGQQRTWNRCN